MRKSGAARFRKHRPLIGSWCRASPKRVRLVICKTQTQTRDITAPRDILLDKHDVLRLYAHDFATMRLSGHSWSKCTWLEVAASATYFRHSRFFLERDNKPGR